MTPEAYFRHLETTLHAAAEQAVEETIRKTRDRMRERIPAKRTKTRRAMQYRVRRFGNVYRGEIALRFSERYRSRHTTTERLFQQSFRKVRSNIAPTLKRRLIQEMRSD